MHRSYVVAALLAAGLGLSDAAQAAEPCDSYAADLAAMVGADQALRKRINFLEIETPAQKKLLQQIGLVDRTNTARLKTLIDTCGWPSTAKHGAKAAGDAWLLAQHADQDLAFQKKVLALIEQAAAESGEGVNRNIAYLTDRIAVAEKRPQPYGTQMKQRSGIACELDFEPMDDRAAVEARRAKLGMPTLDAYRRTFQERLNCPVDSPAMTINGVRHESTKDYHYAPPAAQGKPPRG